jgi:N-hydroxyarylamine O-acetyltransferase
MVLLVDGLVVDVGFGSANPLGPVPLGGEATYGPWTWRTERTAAPEGGEVWSMRLGELPLYTFTDVPQHPVDYLAPNHFTATHPLSHFVHLPLAQHWEGTSQVSLTGLDLTTRRPDGSVEVERVEPAALTTTLRGRFGLALDDDEMARITAISEALPPAPPR